MLEFWMVYYTILYPMQDNENYIFMCKIIQILKKISLQINPCLPQDSFYAFCYVIHPVFFVLLVWSDPALDEKHQQEESKVVFESLHGASQGDQQGSEEGSSTSSTETQKLQVKLNSKIQVLRVF